MNAFLSEGAMQPIQKLNELFAWIIFNTKIGKVNFNELKSVVYKYINHHCNADFSTFKLVYFSMYHK